MKSPTSKRLAALSDRLLNPLDYLLLWYVNRISTAYYRDRSGRTTIQRIGYAMRIGARQIILERMKWVLGPDRRCAEEWAQLWGSYTFEMGRSLVEIVMLSQQPAAKLEELTTLKGGDHLRAALAQNRGVMLLLSHLGAMAAVPAALGSRGYDLTITGNPIPRPFFEALLRKVIGALGIKRYLLTENLPLRAAETFRRNGLFAAFFDHAGPKHNVWLPFGKAEISVSIAPAFMALRCDVPILCVRHSRLSDDHFELEFAPPIPVSDPAMPLRERAVATTRHAIAWFARDVITRPEQWWPWDYAAIRPCQEPVEAARPLLGREAAAAKSPISEGAQP